MVKRFTFKKDGKKFSFKDIKWTKKTIAILVVIIVVIVAVGRGIVFIKEVASIPTGPKDKISYEVRGVDISHYQGDVDWPVLAKQNIAFAFIKATEGSAHIDSKFKYNWENAHKTNLKIGAYHFMSFESSGEKQAEHFIKNVSDVSNMLPPVVDVELYGEFIKKEPSKATVKKILTPLLEKLEKHYGQKPIIYTNSRLFTKYIEDNFDNDIWLSNLSFPDKLPNGKDWEFLQYSFNGKLEGYSGYLPHLDLNVYRGSKFDFAMKY